MLISVSPVTRLQEAFLMQLFYTEDAAEESRKYRMGKDLPAFSGKERAARQRETPPQKFTLPEKLQRSFIPNDTGQTERMASRRDGFSLYLIHPVHETHFRSTFPENLFSGRQLNYFFLASAA